MCFMRTAKLVLWNDLTLLVPQDRFCERTAEQVADIAEHPNATDQGANRGCDAAGADGRVLCATGRRSQWRGDPDLFPRWSNLNKRRFQKPGKNRGHGKGFL